MQPVTSNAMNPGYYLLLGLAAAYACLACIVFYGWLASRATARDQRLQALRAERERSDSARQRFSGHPHPVMPDAASADEVRQLRDELSRFLQTSASSTNETRNLHLEISAMRMRIDAIENELSGHLEDHVAIDTAAMQTKAERPRDIIPAHEFTEIQEFTETQTATEDAPSRMDPDLGLVYASQPNDPDDLTQIWGIGAINQARLQENGIYFFHQIAAWTPEIIVRFDELLSFKGRIEREMWVPQAQRLGGRTELQAA